MSSIFLPLVLFAIGLILLLKGADFAVRGAESLAVKIGVSSTTIGLTVVAFGTSLPELVVSSEAFRRGDFAIGTGNVVGSNIANIGLILGLVALLMPVVCSLPSSRPRLFENALLTLAATMVFALFALRGFFDFLSGGAFLLLFAWMLYVMWRSGPGTDPPSDSHSRYPLVLTVTGLGMVVLGAHLLLTGAVEIAEILSVPPAVIGLSLVAVGTSVPELATSTVAAIKKSPGIALGNILGSNIFNLLFVVGLNSLFFTIPVPDPKDIIVMIAFTLAIFPLFIRRICETRIWGGALIGAYLLYILFLYAIL
ncbi:MAG: calcium/sodium antiporter [Methanoregulaceae archaeon]|nr:calcium/sodium antiporter [Methanoregulaceae archaeon]